MSAKLYEDENIMALTAESWEILQEKLKANADYQYLINYDFNCLYKAKEPQVNPHRIWEFSNKDSEWDLLNYLSERTGFFSVDGNTVICQNGNVDLIVEKLVKYLMAICKFELIAKAVEGKVFYSRRVIKTVFVDKEFVIVFDRNRTSAEETYPGIYFNFYNNDFEQMAVKLIQVDMTSTPGYKNIYGASDTSRSLDKFKLRDIPSYLVLWDRLHQG